MIKKNFKNIVGYLKVAKISLILRMAMLSVLLGPAGCGGPGVYWLSPVSESATNRHQVGKFVWYDLLTDDVAAARRFYGRLFGWTFDVGEDSEYVVILNRGRPIGGIISYEDLEKEAGKGRWLASLSVKDVDQAAEFVRTSGGLIHEQPQTIPDRGRMAVVSDPQDAQLVLLHSESGDPPDRPLAINEWMWNELWTNKKDEAIDFYSLLADYTHHTVKDDSGRDYDVLKNGNYARAGLASITRKNIRPMWLPYIRVLNPTLMVDNVEKLGGRVILAPNPNFENGLVAIVADPSGGVFAMQKWTGKPSDR